MDKKLFPFAIISVFVVNYFYLYPTINDASILLTVSIFFFTSMILIGSVYMMNYKYFTQQIKKLEQKVRVQIGLKETVLKQQDLINDHQLKLEHAQTLDQVTNIPNRKQLLTLMHEIDYPNEYVVFLTIRIENLPKLYTLFGHLTIDPLLKEWVSRLQMVLPSNAIIGRLGTNQFTVIYSSGMQPLSEDSIQATCCSIITFIEAPLHSPDLEQPVYFYHALGLAISNPTEDQQPEHHLYSSELAATEKHKMILQSVYISTDQLFQQEYQKIELESHLREAIDQKNMDVYYQPIVKDGGSKVSYEALSRWKHEGTYISPAIFIPMAERAGMISDLTLNVAEKVASDYHKLIKNSGDIYYLSFNLSPSLLTGKEGEYTLNRLIRVFKHYDVPLNHICLEITEEILIDQEMRNFVDQSRKEGFIIALDDFGTGYSSMSYLVDYDIDVMKLDRSFISELEHNQKQIEVTKAFITLASSLEISIVAEGVERKSQLELLQKLGIQFVQGFYYGKPAPISKQEGINPLKVIEA